MTPDHECFSMIERFQRLRLEIAGLLIEVDQGLESLLPAGDAPRTDAPDEVRLALLRQKLQSKIRLYLTNDDGKGKFQTEFITMSQMRH